MIEIRIVDNGPMYRPDFQYRHLILGADDSGSYVIEDTWSDWKTAEYVKAEEIYNA